MSSEEFLEKPLKEMGPEKLLYIGQREIGGTSPDDGKLWFLSDIVLFHRLTRLMVTALLLILLNHIMQIASYISIYF